MVSKNLLLTNDLDITNFFIPNHSQYLNPLVSLSCPSPRCLSYISKFVTHLFRRCSLHLVSLPKSHFNSHFSHSTSFPSYTYQHFLFSSVCLWGLELRKQKTSASKLWAIWKLQPTSQLYEPLNVSILPLVFPSTLSLLLSFPGLKGQELVN